MYTSLSMIFTFIYNFEVNKINVKHRIGKVRLGFTSLPQTKNS